MKHPLGLPLDICTNRFPHGRDKLSFTILSFSFFSDLLKWKKHFAKKEGFRSCCHFRAGRRLLQIHVVSQHLPISNHHQPGTGFSEAVACGHVANAVHEQVHAVERGRASCKRTRKVRFVIFSPKRSLPIHPSFEMHYVLQKRANL